MRSYVTAFLPLIIIAAVVILYFFFYKLSINRRLANPQSDGSRRFISPSDLALVILSVFLILSNSTNKARINQLTQQINNMNSTINQLSYQISELNRDKSHEFEYYLSTDSIRKNENGEYIASVRITVTPAIMTQKTSASFYIEGRQISLEQKEKGQFTGSFDVATNSHPDSAYLIIHFDDGDIREDIMLEPEKLYSDLIPTFMISGSTEFSGGKLKLNLQIHKPIELPFVSCSLIIKDRDEVLYTQDLLAAKDEDPITVSRNFSVSAEKNAMIYIEATDSRGWKY
ncbi:MAG: hypothetical protein II126_00750, partial [Erysipelotrichaceae bacterium]|nr:hypothetical protein [Erysipelotrichaceae bacterium]